MPCPSLAVPEAKAIDIAIAAGLGPCIIESDCKRIVEAISVADHPPSGVEASLVASIISKARFLSGVSFSFVRREGNSAAHWLALKQKLVAFPVSWRLNLPSELSAILYANFPSLALGIFVLSAPQFCCVCGFCVVVLRLFFGWCSEKKNMGI